MMDPKLLKNFTPYYLQSGPISTRMLDVLQDHAIKEPLPTAWSSIGFAEVEAMEHYIDIQGAGYLACMQINEKILPGPVQRERIEAKIKEIEEIDGRKAGKKTWAQVRDDVALELLPKAFVRRKFVPIIFSGENMFVFTSSAKKADDIVALLCQAMEGFNPARLSNLVPNSITGALTSLAKDGELNALSTSDSTVLHGKDKQSIRVKDKDVASDDVQRLLKQDYRVTQLGLQLWPKLSEEVDFLQTEPEASFVVNEHLVCSRLATGMTKVAGENDDEAQKSLVGTAWVVTLAANDIVKQLATMLGGIKPTAGKTVQADAIDEDDDDL